MIRNVRHVGIVVEKIDEVLPFYRDVLGFQIVKELDEPEKFINPLLNLKNCKLRTIKLATGDNNTLIELLEFTLDSVFKKEEKKVFSSGMSHIALTVKNLDLVYKNLLEAGIQFISPPLTSPDNLAKVAFCRDPTGTYLELVEELK